MASLYADENFKYDVVEHLRSHGHDVVTVQEAGRRGCGDDQVVADATAAKRAVLTFNRRHFVRLHRRTPNHAGIIICTNDDASALADRIHQKIITCPTLDGQLLRIDRPP